MQTASTEFGKEIGLLQQVVLTGRKVGADHTFWAKLAHDELLFESVVEHVRNGLVYKVAVQYHYSLWEMIDNGNYAWWDSIEITPERFAIDREHGGIEKVDMRLLHFNKRQTSKEVDWFIENNNCRSATLAEQLEFGARYPELQFRFPIVQLGTVGKDRRGIDIVTILDKGSRENRVLRVQQLYSYWWPSDCRFAVIDL